MLREELPKIVTETVPGPKAAAMIERRKNIVPDAIGCGYPVVIENGAGAMIEDVDGNVFLDWIGGVGVLNVGHAHPRLVEAVKAQSEKYFHGMFNIVTHEGYLTLAEKLAAVAPIKEDVKKVMFANSGAEADENAVKIAKGATKRPNIIVFSGAFHGRTMLTMTMTAKKAYAVGMGPFPDGVYRAQFPYLYRKPEHMTEGEYLEQCVKSVRDVFENCSPADYVAAIVMEPLQGEGGFIPAPIEFVKAVRQICDENGILLIADEVQTGFGRTGKLFASEYWKEEGCAPDIIATAKSIAGGVPLSAVIASREVMDAVPGGVIGGTYGGNALACAAGIEVLKVMEEEHLLERSNEIGEKAKAAFEAMKEKYEVVGDVRGLGAMIGVEFVTDKATKNPNPTFVKAFVQECAQHGLMVESAGIYGNVIRFLAPLVMTDAQLEAGLKIYDDAIAACMK
ncbi:aspartate aminotransferase family protein [Hespellia stercorisuis]|uniref:(S)-3-amino-2-methylpropionate transaminase n=1 Tax=Hespellia stercorisuis DSM 15480 TaxID=1121950 RepID=A0A1M6K8D7_9FIRM|nr:aspartate aminotransferase family protein [Hespellia stercorisuis]SHJ55232.1 4-aminobutyrate aminotransferase / (S)-3-amino-2-methylpropionate transaminase [Hespellia stercorisuis DSM 15480]